MSERLKYNPRGEKHKSDDDTEAEIYKPYPPKKEKKNENKKRS